MSEKKVASKVWLHHSSKNSICVIVNSKEYKDALKDGGYSKMRVAIVADDVKDDLAKDDAFSVSNLEDKELMELYDECDAELVKRGLLDEPKAKEEVKEDDK